MLSSEMKGEVQRPLHKSNLRRSIGREYYILKRRIQWSVSGRKYAVVRDSTDTGSFQYSLICHRTPMLRPLKDVDMYLQYNKITNLKNAIGHINGVVIRPGEYFSLWKLVGRPTKAKGYLEGLVINNGKISKGTGGGLCQLGNLLYWMILHTELTVTERHRHSFDVFPDVNRTIPFACGATLGYNYIDLGAVNNTDSNFLIRLWQEEDFLCGEILCDAEPTFKYEITETDHSIRQQWWGGYTRHNRICKKRIHMEDGTEDLIPVSENHAIMMYNPLLPE